ncbi:type IV secretory system conjugative DNA transfer family protein [Metamycoplasma auris]|nr:type IV secretory system conjugative DNA transfer family protein [Metamycoplasma auris]
MYFIQTKSGEIFGHWIKGNRNFLYDILNFWETNSNYRNYSFLILFLAIPIFWILLNYKVLYNRIIYKIKNKNNLDSNSNWIYNQFTNEGSFKVLRKKFRAGKANFILGKVKKQFWNNPYIVNNTDAHGIVIGIPGSKKTEKIVIPGIVYNANLKDNEKPNLVISDPKKQILKRTGKILKENGYEIKVFDFIDVKNSLNWNPLQTIWDEVHSVPKNELDENNYNKAFEKIIEIVDALPWPTSRDIFWVNQAKTVAVTVIKFLLLYSLENKDFTIDFFNFKNVATFASSQVFKSGKWVEITKKNKEKNKYWSQLRNEQDALVNIADQTLSGFLANLANVLLPFSQNPVVSKITSKTSISIKDIVQSEKPYVIFLCFPDHKQVFNFLISMLVTQIYRDAIDYANLLPKQKLPKMLQFYLEEFNSLMLPSVADWMAISRSRNILFLLIIQSYEQLKKYDEKGRDASAITAQARLTILLETNSDETLKSLSTTLGDKEVKKESISQQTGTDKQTISTSEQKEPVMSISALKYKDKDMTIISSGGSKPIALNLIPAYEYLKDDSYVHQLSNELEQETYSDWDFFKMEKMNLLKEPKLSIKEIFNEAINEESKKFKLRQINFKQFETYNCYNTFLKETNEESKDE